MKKADIERNVVKEDLRKYFSTPPQDPEQFREYFTVYTKLCHVSKSGMMRVIDTYIVRNNVILRLSWSAAIATGHKYNIKHEGVQADGCGMDMGFHIVYGLSRSLWPDGYMCDGAPCRSNDHSNGDRDRSPHMHHDGGYRLNHRWM